MYKIVHYYIPKIVHFYIDINIPSYFSRHLYIVFLGTLYCLLALVTPYFKEYLTTLFLNVKSCVILSMEIPPVLFYLQKHYTIRYFLFCILVCHIYCKPICFIKHCNFILKPSHIYSQHSAHRHNYIYNDCNRRHPSSFIRFYSCHKNCYNVKRSFGTG